MVFMSVYDTPAHGRDITNVLRGLLADSYLNSSELISKRPVTIDTKSSGYEILP